MKSIEKANLIADAMDSIKAIDIKTIYVGNMTSIADNFVICSCTSGVQVNACADKIQEELLKVGIKPHHVEGRHGESWVLLDFGDVIAHVMLDKTRDYYDLERLFEDISQ